MARDAQRIPRPTVLSLVRGIIDDAKQLVIGHYEFRKYQTLRELAKAKAAAIWIGAGIALAGIGVVLVALMVVHLLHALSNLPLWGSYGIVGIVLLVVGGVFLYAGKNRL
ncbi:MAG TPA: phage holin family protein [Candidatus Binatia bacterium]|nr:phage holin family protein [Candidatus Binatia bacterium]